METAIENNIQLKVRYFGMLADITSCQEEEIITNSTATLGELKTTLLEKYPQLMGRTYKVAINMSLDSNDETSIANGDELSFLPPFAGG